MKSLKDGYQPSLKTEIDTDMTIGKSTGPDILEGLFLKRNVHEKIYTAFAMELVTSVNNVHK